MTGGRGRIRILFVHHRGEPSGASRALTSLIEHLDPKRYEVAVFAPPGPATDELRLRGVPVHLGPVAAFTHIWASSYRGRRWASLAAEAVRLVPHLRALRKVLDQGRFELVHLNDSPLVPAAWLARRSGIPVVWHLRSALATRGAIRRAVLRAAVTRLARAAIAINHDVADSFGVDVEVVNDSVDPARFALSSDRAAARAQLGLPAERPVVSFLGYLYPAKGFRELLGAAVALRARDVPATVVLAGGAVRSSVYLRSWRGRLLRALRLVEDYEAEARALIETHRLADRVRLLPRVADPAPLYAASDVVVHPSRGPEVGLPAIEAAAAGVPVIVTGTPRGGGVVLPDETGRVLPGASPIALADAIADLLLDPGERERLGRSARAHARSTFDPLENAARVEAVYERLLRTA